MIKPNQLGRSPFPASASQWMLVGIRGGGGGTPATGYSLTGPSSGQVGVASTNFTVTLTPGGGTSGGVTITPSDGGGGGTFTPGTVALSTGTPSATFTYTPASAGTKTISTSDNAGLTDPGSLNYVASSSLVDGNSISVWPDSSGNGHDGTQSGAARPIFKTAILNGKPVVRFDAASSQFLNVTTPITGVSPWTIVAVMKSGLSTNSLPSLGSALNPSPFGPFSGGDGSLYAGNRANAFTSGGAVYSAFHVITALSGATNPVVYVDGVNVSGSPFALVGTGDFDAIGKRDTTAFATGDIAEILFYVTLAVGTNQADVEKYLGNKYGIAVAGGTVIDPTSVAGLRGWWKADSLL